jgi:hypothetical protein
MWCEPQICPYLLLSSQLPASSIDTPLRICSNLPTAMPSRHESSYFQPPPPIRTATSGSQKSVSSGAASPDMLSPTSTFARGARSPTSPAEESFFGAITSRIRGRSHSRNRENAAHKRSKSPMTIPPEHLPTTTSTPREVSRYAQHPQKPRHKATASQSSIASTATKATRPSMSGSSRSSTSSSDMWRGRHSNSWLFNDFSVTEHAKDLLHMGRKS